MAARIPRYEERQQVGGVPGTPRASAPDAFGRFVSDVGAIGANLAQGEYRRSEADRRDAEAREDRLAHTQAAVAYANASASFDAYEQDLRQRTQGDPDGYADGVGKAWAKVRDDAIAATPNERARQWVEVTYANAGAHRFDQALRWQAGRAAQYDEQTYAQTADTLAGRVAADDNTYPEAVTLLAMMGDTGRQGAARGAQLTEAARTKLAVDAGMGAVERDPGRVLALMEQRLGMTPEGNARVNLAGASRQAAADTLKALTGLQVAFAPGADVTLDTGEVPKSQAVAQLAGALGIDAAQFQSTMDARRRGEPGKTGNPWADALTPQQAEALRQRAITRLQQGASSERASVERHDRDAAAFAASGKPDPTPTPEATYVRLWGPQEGKARFAEAQGVQQYAKARATFAGMPLGQMAATVSSFEPTSVEGAAGATQRQAMLARAMKDEVEAREKDPAGYVATNSPTVRATFDATFGAGASGAPRWMDQSVPAADRAASMDAYITQSVAEQQRLGIRNLRYIPEQVEADIVRTASGMTSAAPDGKLRGDQMARQVNAYAEAFGPHWPDVYRQVVGGKHGANVPDSFVVLTGVPSLPGREEVARLDGVKGDELKKQAEAVSPGAGKDVEEKVGAQLAPFLQSMLGGALETRTGTAVLNVATKLALARVRDGAKTSDAATQAVNLLVGHLDFPTTGSTRPWAVPKAEGVDAVKAGVEAAMDRIGLWDLPAPPDLSGSRNPEESSAAWTQLVRSRPLWVTNGNESGLLLYAVGDNGQPVAVRWKDGKQVGFDWQALRSFGAEARTGATGERGAVTAPAIFYRGAR